MKDKGKGVGIGIMLAIAVGLWLWARQADGEPLIYTCPYCGAVFSSQAELDAHIETYHPPPTFNWLRPTGHIANGWNDPELAYDGWTDTYAESNSVSPKSWSQPFEFTITPTEISKIRIWQRWRSSHTAIVEVFYNNMWYNIHEDALAGYTWNEISIPGGPQVISKARVTYYNPTRSVSYKFRLCEFGFFGAGEPPGPPTPPPTTTLTGYVTDKITGVPIPGATGTVYQDKGTKTFPYDFFTNAEGYYEITGMLADADQTLMVVYANGYDADTNEHVSISEGANQLDIQMVPA